MEQRNIKISSEKRYATDLGEIEYSDRQIINKQITGCGYTSKVILETPKCIIISPSRNFIINKLKEKRFEDINLIGVYQEDKGGASNTDIIAGTSDCNFCILVTPESFERALQNINCCNLDEVELWIDEYHRFSQDYVFRNDGIRNVIDNLHLFKKVRLLSATPISESYVLDCFKDFDILNLE